MKFRYLIIALVVVLGAGLLARTPSVVKVLPAQPAPTTLPEQSSVAVRPSADSFNIRHGLNQNKAHVLDQLSPKMKQSLRDVLLSHQNASPEIQADGTRRLDTQHHVTQMPVAVKQADGTVVIREYSHVPD